MVVEAAVLPFQMEDACRPDAEKETDVGEYTGEEKESADGLIRVGQVRSDDEWSDDLIQHNAITNNLLLVASLLAPSLLPSPQETRLNYRWLDLRTPANQSIFRVESMVGMLFREILMGKGFTEIHTPKIIGGASEGGSDVFNLDYFGRPACLAMSPQLHKQICAACSGFERVFEVRSDEQRRQRAA